MSLRRCFLFDKKKIIIFNEANIAECPMKFNVIVVFERGLKNGGGFWCIHCCKNGRLGKSFNLSWSYFRDIIPREYLHNIIYTFVVCSWLSLTFLLMKGHWVLCSRIKWLMCFVYYEVEEISQLIPAYRYFTLYSQVKNFIKGC